MNILNVWAFLKSNGNVSKIFLNIFLLAGCTRVRIIVTNRLWLCTTPLTRVNKVSSGSLEILYFFMPLRKQQSSRFYVRDILQSISWVLQRFSLNNTRFIAISLFIQMNGVSQASWNHTSHIRLRPICAVRLSHGKQPDDIENVRRMSFE